MKNQTILVLAAIMMLSSCVSKKKYIESQNSYDKSKIACDEQVRLLQGDLVRVRESLGETSGQLEAALKRTKDLEDQLEYMKNTNYSLLDRLSDLSVVSKSGAESIKKSLETMDIQNKYIKDLTSAAQRKDSLNLNLVMNLKRSLTDINDTDVNIEVKKGVVYISISDKLLFKSASAEISTKAETVLGKIAKVLNDQKDFDILVEGHTDNVPITTACLEDNWDLSVKRATTIVRYLQKKYGVAPERMTAGGRSEFIPKVGNETSEGRSQNRRTEIIILPRLDEFFKLLEAPKE